eukprot:Rmarinus@m.14895
MHQRSSRGGSRRGGKSGSDSGPHSDLGRRSGSMSGSGGVVPPKPQPVKNGSSGNSAQGFNSREVSRTLNDAWLETLRMLDDVSVPADQKPLVHGSAETGAWGSRRPVMAPDKDFLKSLSEAIKEARVKGIWDVKGGPSDAALSQ